MSFGHQPSQYTKPTTKPASPPEQHASQARLVLRRGVHSMCEEGMYERTGIDNHFPQVA
jgi:hypothetical protein